MAKNLLVNGKNNITARANAIGNIQNNMANRTTATNVNATPNLPTRPTTLNLQKAQQPVQTKLNNLNTATMPIQNNNLQLQDTGVGNMATMPEQSRFIGFRQQQGQLMPQARPAMFVPTAVGNATKSNKEEEQRYKKEENLIKRFHYAVRDHNGQMTANDIKKEFKEWKGLEDAALQLQADIRPLVQQGQFADMNQISEYYGDLLKGKELQDINQVKQDIEIDNAKFQQAEKFIDKALKTNWTSLSTDGMKYVRDFNILSEAKNKAKQERHIVGGKSDVEILNYLVEQNPELKKVKDEMENLQLTETDKGIIGAEGAKISKSILSSISQGLIGLAQDGEATKPTTEEIESVMKGKEKLGNEFWKQTGNKIAAEIGVSLDSLEKFIYRTKKDAENAVLSNATSLFKTVLPKSYWEKGLGVNLTDEQYNNLVDMYDKATRPGYEQQIAKNQQYVKDYTESVNKDYESRKARYLDPDVENYTNRQGMTQALLAGDLGAFAYKGAGSAAENVDNIAILAAGIVAPEVVLPALAADSYARESQESFEELSKIPGVSYEQAQEGSAYVGLASSAVETVLEKALGGVETTASKTFHDMFMKEFTQNASEMMAKKGLLDILKSGATTQFRSSLEEGLEEVLQQTIHNASIQQYDPDQKLTEGLLEAFEGGFYNPMNLMAGGGDILSNVDTEAVKQKVKQTANDFNEGINDMLGNRVSTQDLKNTANNIKNTANAVTNKAKNIANRIEIAPGKIGEVFDSMKNKVTSQGGTNNTQQQGQQTQLNTASENQNNINGDNYNQNIKNSKALNSVQLGLLKSNNRMNPTKITEFQDKFGKDYGQALADMGYTESHETNVPKIEKDTKEIYNEKKKAMNSVEGEFQDEALAKMLEMMVQKAENTWDRDMLKKYKALQEKHNTKGLTMAEANDMREEFSYKIKTKWNTENNSDKIDLANNVYSAVKEFLEKTAEANGIKDLQKMNRDIAMRKYLSTWIGDKAERQSANNMVSLTDWVMIAEAAASPYAAAGLVTKKIMQQPTVKNAVLNAVVGRRENRTIDQQNRQATNKERMENIESANRGKELQQELTPSKTPALPNGIKLTKVTEIDNRKPKNKVTKKNNNKKSDSSSSDDGGTPTGGTPTGTNPTNNQGGTTDDTKTKKQPKKKAETKTKTTSKKSSVTDYINETPQNERGQLEEIEAEENLRDNETPQRDMVEEAPKNKVTSKKAEATAPKTKTVDISNVKNISDLRNNLENKEVGDHRVDYGYINGKYYEIEEFVGEYHIVEGDKPSDINHAKNGVAIGGQYVNTINGLKAFIEGKSNGEVIKADRIEETTPKQEENQTSEHFSYKDYGEFMKKYEAAEKEINDRLDKQMDKERAEKMERFNELTKKEDKTDAEGDEMMKLAGELNNMSNKYDRLKEQEFNKKHPELVAEKQRQNEMFDRDWKAAMDKKMEEMEKPYRDLRDKYLNKIKKVLGFDEEAELTKEIYDKLAMSNEKRAEVKRLEEEWRDEYNKLLNQQSETKTRVTNNSKNKITTKQANPAKAKTTSLFDESEVDKGNKSEGLNPDALPLSDYREMQRLNVGRYNSIGSALRYGSIRDYMATKIANELVGDYYEIENDDYMADEWEEKSETVVNMYDAYEEYQDMKNGSDQFDENTLKNTLESANDYANRIEKGKTAKELIDKYTPEYESDLKIYNRLNEKYPGVFSNGKIDLTGAEGRSRREFASQENETAQDIDYQELAEIENQTPQDIDYQDLAELENETPQMVDIDEGVDATTQLVDEFNNLKPGEFKWIGDNREAGVRKTFLDANIKIPGEGDSVDIYFQPGESGDKMYINLHDTSNTGIRNTNEVLNKLDIPYRIGSEFDEKLNETRYYLENKLTHSKAYFDKNGASWLSVSKTLRGKEIVPRRNAEEQAEYNMQMEQRRAEIEAEREQDRIKAEERKAEEERQQEIDKQMKANLLRYVDIKHNDNPLGRGRTLKDLSEKNSEANNRIRYYGDDVSDDAGVWQVLDVLANKNGKIKEVRESDSKSSYSYEYYDEELGRNNNISGLNKTQRDYLEFRIKASQTEKRVNDHLDKIENKSLKTRVENKLNEMTKRQDDNGKTQYGTDAQYIDYLVLDKGFTPKEFPTGKTYANGEPKIDYMIVNEKNVGYISSKIENDYAKGLLETPEEELSAEDEAKLDELFTPKTTTEVTGEKNAVTAKQTESEKPKNLVTNRIENTKQEIQEIDKDTYFDDIVKNLKDHPREMFIYKDGSYFYPHYILPSGKVLTPENTYWGEVSSEEAAKNWLLKEAEEHSEANETKKAEKLKEIVGKTAEKYEATLKRIESDNPMQEIWTSGDYFKYGVGNNQMARAKKESEANAEVGTFKKDVIDGKEGYRIFVAGTKNEAIRAFYEPKTGKTYRIYRGPIIDDSKPYTTKQVERIEKFLQNVDKQLDKETKKEKKEEKQVITQERLDSLKPDKDGVIELDYKGDERWALGKGKEALIKEGKADGKYLYNYGGAAHPQYMALYIKNGIVYEGRKGLEDQYMTTKQEAVDWLNQKEKDVEHEATDRYTQTDYETLPKTVSVEEESEKAGPKRIAPDRVKRQQETYDQGLESVKNVLKQSPVKIYELGFKSDRSKAVQNILEERKRIRQLPETEAEPQWNELAKSIYEDLVIKDISKGYRYPEDVTSKFPKAQMKKAVDARARYEKGLFTSFSAKDTRANNQYRDEIGAGIKSQDGKPVTQEQMNEIVDGIRSFGSVFGLNMKKFAEDNNIIYVHLHGGNPFLMGGGGKSRGGGMNIAGLYRKGADGNISISLGGVELVMEKGEDGEMKKNNVNATPEHELAHAVDYMLENKLFSSQDIEILKKTMNKPTRLINYYNRSQEIVARAVEQYAANKTGKSRYGKPYISSQAYWDQENFDKYVKPIVEKNMKEKLKDYLIQQPKNNVIANDKNKITSK